MFVSLSIRLLLAPRTLLACGLLIPSHLAGNDAPPRLDGLVTLAGKPANPFAPQTNITASVLLFIAVDCPLSNRYAPEIKRLRSEFEPRGVRFWLVYSDSEIPPNAIKKHARDFGLSGDVLRDLHHRLVKWSQVQVTPEAAVMGPSGALLYHGRIDDRFPALGVVRAEPTERTLETMLTSYLSGKTVWVRESKAIGCRIPSVQ